MSFQKNILICLCGLSPAVITETLYSLLKSESWIPDKLLVITTLQGKNCIEKELLTNGLWDDFLQEHSLSDRKIFGRSAIHVIPDSAFEHSEDIIHSKSSELAADFILSTLRQYTENPDTEIVFSIAGGRKTMSAISALCMSMLGRHQDRLCHVLVNYPFDTNSISPKFYYPSTNPRYYSSVDGRIYSDNDAQISLAWIPYVNIRYLFQNHLRRLPGTFSDTVVLFNKESAKVPVQPSVELSSSRRKLLINGVDLEFSAVEFFVYYMLLKRASLRAPEIRGQKDLCEAFCDFINQADQVKMRIDDDLKARLLRMEPDDMRKIIGSICSKLKKRVSYDRGLQGCLPNTRRGVYGVAVILEDACFKDVK